MRSTLRSFALVAIASIASIAATAYMAVRNFVVAPFRIGAGSSHIDQAHLQAQPSMGLVAAKAFLMRMAQRPRPTDTPLWRMSPVS